MKKILLAALTLFSMTAASAAITGTYKADKYKIWTVGDNWKFSSGELSTEADEPEEGEEIEDWFIEIATAEDGSYTITNLIGWDETLACTYDEEAGTLSIAGGSEVYVDEEGYITMISGGLEGYSTAKGVMDYCDANGGWIVETRGLEDVVLKIENGELTNQTPLLIYTDYYPGYGYHGSAVSVYDGLAFGQMSESTSDAEIEGTYKVTQYTGYEVGDDYKFASGYEFSSDDPLEEGEEYEDWFIVITKNATDEGTSYTINNLIGWEEDVEAQLVETTEGAQIVVKGGTLIDDTEYNTYVSGGLDGYTTAQGIMDYCDANNGWIVDTRGLKDIIINVGEDGVLSLGTPILTYTDYYPDYGYHGIAISLYTRLTFEKAGEDGISSVNTDNSNAPVEYYNLQGIRLNHPTPGQIVIKRQGSTATKIIVR